MKKIFYSLFALMMATFSFSSCEDVPAPYDTPTAGGEDTPGDDGSLNTIFSENFDGSSNGFSFQNVTIPSELSYVWKVSSYNNNNYLNASAFANSASHATEAWAVSPAIDLTDSHKAVLTFRHAINKLNDTSMMKDMMTVWASTDYNGDVKTATWTKLTVPTYPNGTSWTFVESGDIDLAAYCGKKVTLAFKYTSTDSNSGGWEVDDFTVKGDGTSMTPDTPETPDQPQGENLLTNGDFESWTGNTPTNWKSTSSAGNATLAQSTDAHSGTYSVKVSGTSSANKRLAYKEITLKAGTYTMSFYAKAATAEGGGIDMGYVPVTDGKVGSYVYAKAYPTINSTDWTLVTYSFTLDAQTTVCPLVMVSKNPGKDVLIDDFSLTTSNGGLVDGGTDEPTQPTQNANFTLVTSISDGTYILVAKHEADYLVASPLTSAYGYLKNPVSVTDASGKISASESNAFTIKAVANGYTIQDASGEYYYMKGTYDSFNRSAELPTSGGVWKITVNADHTVNIQNVETNKTIQFDTQYNSYGAYADMKGILPFLYKK